MRLPKVMQRFNAFEGFGCFASKRWISKSRKAHPCLEKGCGTQSEDAISEPDRFRPVNYVLTLEKLDFSLRYTLFFLTASTIGRPVS